MKASREFCDPVLRRLREYRWGFLWGAILLFSGCGQNPPSNSTNLNFPFGIAIYSDTSTPSNSFMAITNYGTHQVLLFPNYRATFATAPVGTATATNFLLSGLQGPDGLLVYPASNSISGYTPTPITRCTSPALLVADGTQNAIYIYCGFNPSKQNQQPDITIQGNNTQLTSPEGLSMDTVNSSGTPLPGPILFVANSGAGGVLAFDLSQITGPGVYNLSPSGGLLSGVSSGICNGVAANNTSLNCPSSLYFSNQLKTLFVSNTGNNEVMIYANGYCLGVAYESSRPSECAGNTNVQPSARLSGTNTYLSTPDGIAVFNNSLYVADAGAGDVLIWDHIDQLIQGVPTGQESPSRKIGGNIVNFSGPYGIAIDPNIQSTPSASSGIGPGTGTFFISQIGSSLIDGFSPATTFTGNDTPTFQVTVPALNGTTSAGSGSGLGFP
ncbi:MAG: NHL repeat-containing protein [Leptospirales bacterium]